MTLHLDLSGGAAAPELEAEAPLLDLPRGAEAVGGQVVLRLDYPVELRFRGAPSGETLSALTMMRLTGADVRRVTDAPAARGAAVALAASLRWTPARTALVLGLMDASDAAAAHAVVAALLDVGDGLPERAREEDGRVVLPLLFLVGERTEIVFRRLTGADLQAIAGGKDVLTQALARAAALSPAEARELFDTLDGADAMGVSRVVGFLSGSGRMTGR